MLQTVRSKTLMASGLVMLAVTFMAMPSVSAAASEQKTFKTCEEACKAVIAACKTNNVGELTSIFGPASKELMDSGDKVAEKNARADFAKNCESSHRIVKREDGSAEIVVGSEGWPFPVPLVEVEGGWQFDSEEGLEEILSRRVGKNELDTIETMRAVAEAQAEYFTKDRDADEVHEYAQKFASTAGKQDGLFWKAANGEDVSPLGPLVAEAQGKGYFEGSKEKNVGKPFQGYLFKILTSQGKSAPGGQHKYVMNDNMIAGFAVVAYPAKYGSSGVTTFVINHQGKLYEKDLGEKTKDAGKMKGYNPDASWKLVK